MNEPYVTREAFSALFFEISADLERELACKCWHALLWLPMLAFWIFGGFMLMIWGIERAKWAAIAAIGRKVGPFCGERGLSYVLIAAQPGGKSGPHSYRPGTAAVVRFFLPA